MCILVLPIPISLRVAAAAHSIQSKFRISFSAGPRGRSLAIGPQAGGEQKAKGENKRMQVIENMQTTEARTEEADNPGPQETETMWETITLESQHVTSHDAWTAHLVTRKADFCSWQKIALPTVQKKAI